MIAPLFLTAALVYPASSTPSPTEAAPPAAAIQWDSAGFTPPAPGLVATAFGDPSATVVERFLQSGGLLGGGTKGGAASVVWFIDNGKMMPSKATADPARFAELPAGWLALDATRKESALLTVTIDANALRTSAEALFDASWFQRTLDRLALDNARLLSLRGTVLPPTADKLPPLLELKAVTSARSVAPGTPLRPITLIAAGWGGTNAETAAVDGANWAASIRADSGGLGRLGRDGGVGTWAGLVRLAVDLIGAVNSTDAKVWAKEYTTWQERTTDSLRSLTTRLQPRGTLACYGSASAPDLVLVIPARAGEHVDTVTKAMEQFAGVCGLTGKGGEWTVTSPGPLTPHLAISVCETGSGPFLVLSVEHDVGHALLQQTAARLRNAK